MVILVSDAHTPKDVVDPQSERKALMLVECLGLDPKYRLSMDEFYAKLESGAADD